MEAVELGGLEAAAAVACCEAETDGDAAAATEVRTSARAVFETAAAAILFLDRIRSIAVAIFRCPIRKTQLSCFV